MMVQVWNGRWFKVAAVLCLMTLRPDAAATAEAIQTCSDAHAYCMRLCNGATTTPPPDWTCEKDRCFGLQECLNTGNYRIGTQYGHRPSSRTVYGPYEKK